MTTDTKKHDPSHARKLQMGQDAKPAPKVAPKAADKAEDKKDETDGEEA